MLSYGYATGKKNIKEVPTDEENLPAQEETEKQGTRFQKKNGYC